MPDRGSIRVFGREVTDLSFDEALEIRQSIGMVFQNAALFDSVRGRDTAQRIRVGLVIVIAALVLAYGIFQVGRLFDVFPSRYPLVTLLDNGAGLIEGAPVTLAGQRVGQVDDIRFLPVDERTDSTNIVAVLAVNRDVEGQIRSDSRASLQTQGLLGNRFIDISPGSTAAAPLQPGDTIPAVPALDYESVLRTVATRMTEVQHVVGDLQVLTDRARGPLGAEPRDPGLLSFCRTARRALWAGPKAGVPDSARWAQRVKYMVDRVDTVGGGVGTTTGGRMDVDLRGRVPARRTGAEAEQPHRGLVISREARPMLVYDPATHRIVDANAPACRLYGYDRATLLEMRIADLRPESEIPLLHKRLEAVPPREEVRRRGVQHQDRHGNRFHVSMEAFPIRIGGRELRVVRLRRDDDPVVTGFERQALLFHGVQEAVIFTDAEGLITDWNAAAERLWGYDRDFVRGHDARFLKPAGGAAQIDEIMETVARDGVWEGPLQTEAADGSARHCQVRVLPIRDETGVLLGTVGINRDVTEARRTEQALRQSTEELRVLADQLPHTLWVTDAEGGLAYLNERGRKITGPGDGLSAETSWTRIVHPDDREETLRRWGDALDAGREFVLEHRLRTAGGGYRWHITRATPVRGEEGRVIRWVGSSVDIDVQKSSEDAVRRREEYFRSVFEYAHDAIVLFDLETGRVLDANPEAERLYGYRVDSFRDRSLTDLYEDPTAIRALIREVERRGFGSEILTQRSANQDYVQVEVNAALMDHRDARVLLTINRDLSERRRLEDRLQRAEKLEAVGRLAGGLAHDFNNLTTAILGFAGLLSERVGSDDEARDALQEIHAAAQRASELTRQLLAYTRQQVMRGQVLDMNEVVESSLQLLSRLIGEDIEIVTHLDPDIDAVRADPGQLHQVIMNLAVNARDAMAGGGRLTLATTNVVLDRDFADSHPPTQPGRYVRLRMADTGHGMSEETRAHAFDPFFTTKHVGEGAGLGLATVYGIVKQSGGYIWVDSEEDAGTTFDIYLPRVTETPEPQPKAPEAPSAPAAGDTDRTILLVEDEDAVRKLARRVLERAGYTVLEAVDGQEALELVETESPEFDLLLTDMVMPRMSGKELAGNVSELYPGTPVLFMTGYTGETLAERGDLTRTDVVLEKPFKPAELVAAVARMIEAR